MVPNLNGICYCAWSFFMHVIILFKSVYFFHMLYTYHENNKQYYASFMQK